MTVTEVLGVWFVSRDLLGYSGKPGQLREAIVLVLWGNLHSLEQLSISRMLASAGTRHNVPESLLPQVGVHTFLIVTEPVSVSQMPGLKVYTTVPGTQNKCFKYQQKSHQLLERWGTGGERGAL